MFKKKNLSFQVESGEVGQILLILMKSDISHQDIIAILKIQFIEIIDRIRKQFKNIEKNLSEDERIEFKNEITEIENTVSNLDYEKAINEIVEIIETNFSNNGEILIEGFIYGFYQWLKKIFVPYYNLLILDISRKHERQFQDFLISFIPKEKLLNQKFLNDFFEVGNYEEDENESNDKTIMNHNIEEIRKILKYSPVTIDKILENFHIIRYDLNSIDDIDEKKKGKDMKKIQIMIKNWEEAKTYAIKEVDGIILTTIKRIISRLLAIRKTSVEKSLKEYIVNSLG